MIGAESKYHAALRRQKLEADRNLHLIPHRQIMDLAGAFLMSGLVASYIIAIALICYYSHQI